MNLFDNAIQNIRKIVHIKLKAIQYINKYIKREVEDIEKTKISKIGKLMIMNELVNNFEPI